MRSDKFKMSQFRLLPTRLRRRFPSAHAGQQLRATVFSQESFQPRWFDGTIPIERDTNKKLVWTCTTA